MLEQEINSYRPLNKHPIQLIKEFYRIKLIYSSNALEGNSLTESETKIVLEEEINELKFNSFSPQHTF